MTVKKWKIVVVALATVLVIMMAGSCIYLSDYYHADQTALEVMAHETANVRKVQEGNALFFEPEKPLAGLIFYPGGKVQCEAYAPLMQACAENGLLCALVEMPGNLAVLNPNAANGIRERYPEITSWYMAGHSLGGAMAASYVSNHTDSFDGLILLAAYSTNDISNSNLNVLSIYGSEDGVLDREAYEKNRTNLPESLTEQVLDGGCHAYFGSYGAQKGDGIPTLTNQEQIQMTADTIENWIAE